MAQYKVFFKKSVEKDFKGIPRNILLKILDKIKNLQDDPRPIGSEKLTGQERYRITTRNISYCLLDTRFGINGLGYKNWSS